MRHMGKNEKLRALGYLDGRSGRVQDKEIAQSLPYSLGYADGETLRKARAEKLK